MIVLPVSPNTSQVETRTLPQWFLRCFIITVIYIIAFCLSCEDIFTFNKMLQSQLCIWDSYSIEREIGHGVTGL